MAMTVILAMIALGAWLIGVFLADGLAATWVRSRARRVAGA
jgi:hypothetical protein